MVCLVGQTGMERLAVRVRVDGDASDTHLSKGPDNADGDLPAVGDQNLPEHPQVIPFQLE
jgi:hypothetical protein